MRKPSGNLHRGLDYTPPRGAHNLFETQESRAIPNLTGNIKRLTVEPDAIQVDTHQIRVALGSSPKLMLLCRLAKTAQRTRARR